MASHDAHAINAHLTWVREHSPYYRDHWADAWSHGPPPPLEALPLTDHPSYWQANGPVDSRLRTGPQTNGLVFKSGGTTGEPKFSFFSNDDWRLFCKVFGDGMRRGGMRAGDRIADIFYGGQLYASLLFIGRAIEAAHVGVNYPLAGFAPVDEIVAALEKFRIDTIAGVPTTIMNLLPRMMERRNHLQVRRILFGGEAMYPDQIADITGLFPQCRVQSIGIAGVDYGEMGWADEACDPGVHRVFDESTVLELLDETGHPLHAAGDEGDLYITNYRRRLMPVIRYGVGDRGRWIDPPDSPHRRFQVLGRTDKGARVGPMTLYLEDIRRILADSVPAGLTRAFQLIIEHRERRDVCTLRLVSTEPPATPDSLNQAVTAAIYRERPMYPDLIRDGIVHPLRIEWVGPDHLITNPRTGKCMQVVDRRANG